MGAVAPPWRWGIVQMFWSSLHRRLVLSLPSLSFFTSFPSSLSFLPCIHLIIYNCIGAMHSRALALACNPISLYILLPLSFWVSPHVPLITRVCLFLIFWVLPYFLELLDALGPLITLYISCPKSRIIHFPSSHCSYFRVILKNQDSGVFNDLFLWVKLLL